MPYVKFTKPPLRSHPEGSERRVQDRTAEDPPVLGLGDVVLKGKERSQPRAGRLDMFLPQADDDRRSEVEIQPGQTDESHINLPIEYWDIERKRHPPYDHTAVLTAEVITARFLNVMGLFNSAIPMVAIQPNALRVGNNIVLDFVKVLDEIVPGEGDEARAVEETVGRAYREAKGSKE
jgi:hypothetical protein